MERYSVTIVLTEKLHQAILDQCDQDWSNKSTVVRKILMDHFGLKQEEILGYSCLEIAEAINMSKQCIKIWVRGINPNHPGYPNRFDLSQLEHIPKINQNKDSIVSYWEGKLRKYA